MSSTKNSTPVTTTDTTEVTPDQVNLEVALNQITLNQIANHLIDGDASVYKSADQGTKARVRTLLQKSLEKSVLAADLPAAQRFMAAQTLAKSSATSTKQAVEIDHRSLLAQRIANLRAAADLLESGHVRPEGFPVGVEVDLPVVEFDTDSATKLASVKLSRSTERNSIEAAIERAFEGQPSGTFLTVAEIRKGGTTEDYTPGDGAIAARLFPKSGKCTLDAVTPTDATATSPRGATKV